MGDIHGRQKIQHHDVMGVHLIGIDIFNNQQPQQKVMVGTNETNWSL